MHRYATGSGRQFYINKLQLRSLGWEERIIVRQPGIAASLVSYWLMVMSRELWLVDSTTRRPLSHAKGANARQQGIWAGGVPMHYSNAAAAALE